MLGHRVDAGASHGMLCASYGCFFITRDALHIIRMSSASSVMLGHRLVLVHRRHGARSSVGN